ncbi:MAG: ATP-grasp domain-containing protein [Verrucomicrobia bacterium]|nr:ATP-grasp domain-containing protein [Verrucomicrobiota bacterium]
MSPPRKNVLIFPAGSEIGFELYNSLRFNLHVELFGASGKPDHARFIYPSERYAEGDYYIQNCDFPDKFNALLRRWAIDFIYPTHDSIALHLAACQSRLAARVIGSPYASALLARRKSLTYKLFADEAFCPGVYPEPYEPPPKFPVFLKPDEGQGGQGTCLVHDAAELRRQVAGNPGLLVCEHLPGEELSVDCFTDRHGVLRFIGPRTRERVTIGISFESATVPLSPDVQAIAESINRRVKLRGAWFFQVKQNATCQWKLLEFAVRPSSTMGLYRQCGVNFALLSLFDAMDSEVRIVSNNYPARLSRSLQSRYLLEYRWQHLYIDFDDTLIINGKVNVQALALLYQCRNRGHRVSLLTKHRYDIRESLRQACIPEALFDEILVLRELDEKHDFIDPEAAIFVDNHFPDREKVHRLLGVAVFDVDGIESLIGGLM